MRISFVGSQSSMTDFQRKELANALNFKECSEFIFCDTVGSELEAAKIAESNGILLFSVHPVADGRKRGYFKDSDKLTINNRVELPYITKEGVLIKWHPTEPYMQAHQNAYNGSEFIIACPKEFKFSVRSATWGVIKYVWNTKKDNIIIIPPIQRPSEEEFEAFYSTERLGIKDSR
jgi:hypothetical protein